uniref:glutathione transferase n=1 Tax=Chenopodium quinoa TaxID=63459 RepID=A0A803MPH5_CHEQI
MANIAVWMEVEAHRFDPIATKLIHELLFTSYFDKETDNAIVEENEAKLAKVLDVYEARLAMSKYLAGECFTLADLDHMPALQYIMRTKVKQLIDECPHETDNAIVEENEAKFAKILDVYEAHLATSKYLAGDCFTLADLHHMPALNCMMRTKVKQLLDERPHISAWCKDILARPAWQKVWALHK